MALNEYNVSTAVSTDMKFATNSANQLRSIANLQSFWWLSQITHLWLLQKTVFLKTWKVLCIHCHKIKIASFTAETHSELYIVTQSEKSKIKHISLFKLYKNIHNPFAYNAKENTSQAATQPLKTSARKTPKWFAILYYNFDKRSCNIFLISSVILWPRLRELYLGVYATVNWSLEYELSKYCNSTA